MANTIKHKRSAVPDKTPLTTDLELGELAVNTYDGKLYLKKDNGAEYIVRLIDEEEAANKAYATTMSIIMGGF